MKKPPKPRLTAAQAASTADSVNPVNPVTQATQVTQAGTVSDLRGGVRLVVDGTRHITGLVEALHGQVQRVAPPLRRRPLAPVANANANTTATASDTDGLPPSRGLARLVYRSIQSTTGLVGAGLDKLLARFDAAGPSAPGAQASLDTPRRDALVSALNGVLGDHLQRSGNPLAIPFQLRQGGQLLQPALLGAAAPRQVLLLVHGLCMGDGGWLRSGHDHGALLGAALGAHTVYARYNSGRHISDNGLALAQALQALLHDWPVPLDRLLIVGHSMGGLVARSALQQAAGLGHSWPQRVSTLVFLGTPHHGAPLERAGNWLHRALDVSPYLAPFTRLSRIRSDGITDLRHGNLLAADWQGASRYDHHDRRTPVPLPAGVACYAIASTVGTPGHALARLGHAKSLLGHAKSMSSDGLVTVDSALGRHKRAALCLGFAPGHTWVGHGIHHLDLLNHPAVYRSLLGWLGG